VCVLSCEYGEYEEGEIMKRITIFGYPVKFAGEDDPKPMSKKERAEWRAEQDRIYKEIQRRRG